jgi:hypothetical protein
LDENRFWSMIEAAWGTVGGKAKSRQRLAQSQLSEGRAYSLGEIGVSRHAALRHP